IDPEPCSSGHHSTRPSGAKPATIGLNTPLRGPATRSSDPLRQIQTSWWRGTPQGTWQTDLPSASLPFGPQAIDVAPHVAGTTVREPLGVHNRTLPSLVWYAAVSPLGAQNSCAAGN